VQLDETRDLLRNKGQDIELIFNELSGMAADGIAGMFAGDEDAIKDSMKQMLALVAGYIQNMLKAFVMELLLTDSVLAWLSALPFPANLAAIPIAKALIEGAVNAIVSPVLNEVLSFATGGRVEEPTLAIVGDAARLGSQNREWIFSDPQLIATIQMASANANAVLIQRLSNIEQLLSQQELTAKLKGQDIAISLARTRTKNASRAI